MADLRILKSRFARRIFVLFILCAMLPLFFLAIISFVHVGRQIEKNTHSRLDRQATNLGLNIIERLVSAGSNIELAFAYYVQHEEVAMPVETGFEEQFLAMALVRDNASGPETFLGTRNLWPDLSTKQKQDLAEGATLIFSRAAHEGSSEIFMARSFRARSEHQVTFISEIRPGYLLSMDNDEENKYEPVKVSIIEGKRIIVTTMTRDENRNLLETLRGKRGVLGDFSWSNEERTFYSGRAPVFLQSRFKGPFWLLVLSEPKAYAYQPVAQFRIIFAFGIILAFIVVVLLSIMQIRRYLDPLEKLRESTLKISRGDLSTRVNIASGNEIEELADSFNSMIVQLDRQFKTISAIASIDRAILSTLDFVGIIENFTGKIREICPCDASGVCFRYIETDTRWINHYDIASGMRSRNMEVLDMAEADIGMFREDAEVLLSGEGSHLPECILSLKKEGMEFFLLMPLFMNSRLMAVLYLAGLRNGPFTDNATINQIKSITSRMAVAFSHAYLVNELKSMSWGTLTALARVVDAKSPWTAGHSERVAALAYRIGEAMGLSRSELDVLNKAGLLHDIGKVSTPPMILDKKDKLSPEEYDDMKEHPEKGARILEPIATLAPTIPVILQHHERFDGKGFPKGLKGKGIVLGARILAVADAFDAMISDRPYRAGMKVSYVIQEIRHESGRQFDPAVVDTFLKIMDDDERVKECA